jgi:hypothetical protein
MLCKEDAISGIQDGMKRLCLREVGLVGFWTSNARLWLWVRHSTTTQNCEAEARTLVSRGSVIRSLEVN